jgi:Ca2+-binding RTX toxin-like protein
MTYSGVFVFGDSLVDSGNALKLAQWYGSLPLTDLPDGAPTASLGYFLGRFSNGYNFADLLANKAIGSVTKPIFPYGFEDPWLGIPIAPFASDPNGNNLNFAYGGAQIRQGDEVVPDLDGQTDTFRDAVDGDADPNALYLVTMGGNDVRNLAPSGSDPVPQADGFAALDKAADKLTTELSQLVGMGAQHILITGVPDVGLIPKYDRDDNLVLDAAELARSAAATEYSIYLDMLIRTEVVPALQALGATVTYVPLMDYVDASGNLVTGALSANLGTIAALHGLTADELSGNLLVHQDLLFFDQIHPNAQANALLGAYMHAQLTGTPWIEMLPLTAADVDYRTTATIAAPGEVDSLVVSLVAGTTYTIEMLGMSSLGTAGSLADPSLRLLGPSGALFGSNADDGAGFDARLTFTAAATGNYTIELSSTGAPTGSYSFQAAVVGGTATQSGNTYTVDNASTLVFEGAGGLGQDVVKASVSYALAAGSEIEVLRTTHDKGKTAIDLTGNEFGQTIVGNSAANVIEGKGGADVLTGGAGKDVFVLSNTAVTSPGPSSIDRITDYAAGDVVDVTQVLNVAAGTNVLTAGYLRVTTSGLVQVDLDGGANNWVTLSTINGTGAVAVRYLSGGALANVSVNRVAESSLRSMSAANSNAVLAGALAAAGLLSSAAAAESPSGGDDGPAILAAGSLAVIETEASTIRATDGHSRSSLAGETLEPLDSGAPLHPVHGGKEAPVTSDNFAGGQAVAAIAPVELANGTDIPAHGVVALVAQTVAMPSAAMLQTPADDGQATGEVARVLADALSDGAGNAPGLDVLLDALAGPPGAPGAVAEAISSHGFADLGSWGMANVAALSTASLAFTDAMAFHHDAPPLA